MSDRIQKLRSFIEENKLDGMLISKPENRRYFSGFTGSSAQVLVTPDKLFLFTDFRYIEQAALQAPAFTVFRYTGTPYQVMGETFQSQFAGKPMKLGFEGDFLIADAMEAFKSVLPQITWQSFPMDPLRMVKDAEELSYIRKAMEIAEAAYTQIQPLIKPGISEATLSLELEIAMRRLGAQNKAFEIIIASGHRGAFPHGVASDKLLEEGDLITFDFGAVYKGYISDMTRTICLGRASDKQKEIYNLVLKAQLAALAAIRPGVTGQEVDAAARDIIAAGGYGEQFGHGLGHGIGLVLHEEPRLSTVSTTVLAPDMAVTVEPGIYIPGWGGVRIEDSIFITAQGYDNLNTITKELIELG